MRVVGLNVQRGGGSRIPALVKWIASCNADIVVLSEWHESQTGEALRSALEGQGFTTRRSVSGQPNRNGLMVAARHAFDVEIVTPAGAHKGEMLLARLPKGLFILAAYFPQLHAKAPFFEACMAIAKRHAEVPFLLIGDLNTGRNDVDIEGNGTPFHCEDLFLALETRAELRDLWRAEYGKDRREWTWRSRANGFRVDHAFGNQELITRLGPIHTWYDHATRESAGAITDHSALIVDLRHESGS